MIRIGNNRGNKDRTIAGGKSNSSLHHDNPNLSRTVVCNGCGALFIHGKWIWKKLPSQLPESVICPACKRIEEENPAGIVTISGSYYAEHRSLVINLIRNLCKKSMAASPLERCIKIDDEKDVATITTTGEELARDIGNTLFNVYSGELNYSRNDHQLAVLWHR